MKIIVRIDKSGNSFFDDAERLIRNTLAHISDKIWLKSIKKADEMSSLHANINAFHIGKDNVYIIETKPQMSNVEDDNMVQLVKNALRMNGNIQLLSIHMERTIQVKGIQEKTGGVYEVPPYFAEFVARNDKYREDMQSKRIVEAQFEMEEIGQGSYRPTGSISTTTQPGERFVDPDNIYNCFAAALSSSEFLRKTLVEGNILEVLLAFNQQHELIVNVTEMHAMKFSMFAKAAETKVEGKPEASTKPNGP